MDEASAAGDDQALLTLELILLDLTWIRLPKLDHDQLIIPTLCFKVLDFPLVTFSSQQKPTDSKTKAVVYNQGKSCVFNTSLNVLSKQLCTYPIYSFLMDTGSQPAPMVAFGSFPLQAVFKDISQFLKDSSSWPTVSAQHGQAYLRNTRGKKVALINFVLRLSCLSEGSGGVPGGTGEPALAAEASAPRRLVKESAASSGEQKTAAAAARWPQWNQPLTGEDSTAGGRTAATHHPAETSESFESTRKMRVVQRIDHHQLPGPAAESEEPAQDLRAVRLTDRPPTRVGLPGDRHVAWEVEEQRQQRWDDHPHTGRYLYGGPPPSFEPTRPDDMSVDGCLPPAPPPPPPLIGHPRPARGSLGAPPAAARSRSSSADRPPDPSGGGSCWRAPLETDEGSLASDASSGPLVSRLIQELAAMQRATANSKHVAVQTKPLRELQIRAPPPIHPIRNAARRRARPPRVRRLPLISEEPVTEGFARRRAAGAGILRRPPPPPPDTTVVDRLSRGQPVAERRTVASRLRVPRPRLRPVTLTRTAQLRLAQHMADVRHDLHAQEYGRRRDRWLAEQRRRMGRDRPRAPLPPPLPLTEMFPQHQQTSPPSGRSAPIRKRRRRPAAPSQSQHSARTTAVKSIGVQFESDDGSLPVRERVKSAAVGAERNTSPLSSFVEPRLAASPSSRSTELRTAGDRRSSPGASRVKSQSDILNSTGGTSNLSRGLAAETPSPDLERSSRGEGRRSKLATVARSNTRSSSEAATRSRSDTASRSAAGRQPSPSYSAMSFDRDPPPVRSSASAERRRRSPVLAPRLVTDEGKSAGKETMSGSGGAGRWSKSPASGGDGTGASARLDDRRSSGDSVTSSTLRTERHVSEEMVSAARRSPPSAASTVKTESAASPGRSAEGSSRRSSRRTASSSAASQSVKTQSVPTQSASASQTGKRSSASQGSYSSSSSSGSSEEESSESASSESSSSLTETSRTQTQTRTRGSVAKTSSGTERAVAPAGPIGKSVDSSRRQKSGTGARPKPAPRGPPTWQRLDEPPETVSTKPAVRAASGGTAAAVSSTSARPPPASEISRSRSSSHDSAEIDARIAMFLKQSDEKQRQQEQEREQQERLRRQEREAAAAAVAPAGAGWLKGSSAAVGNRSGVGGGGIGGAASSWLKAWRVDDDDALPPTGAAAGGRRASRGRHTLSQLTAAAGLNTDSVSSYMPSELDGGTLSDLTPP